MSMARPSITKRPCIKCGRLMAPEFELNKLRGWSCQCGHYDKAILRERRFTKDDAEAENRR